jgi:hypothetical protein
MKNIETFIELNEHKLALLHELRQVLLFEKCDWIAENIGATPSHNQWILLNKNGDQLRVDTLKRIIRHAVRHHKKIYWLTNKRRKIIYSHETKN